jgi:Stage III sporulation protein D.
MFITNATVWANENLRAETLGEYIVEHRATVRDAAAAAGISKSTVHKDVTEKLRDINYPLFVKVREVLDVNKSERHIRGGNATREKYRRLGRQNIFPADKK